MAAAMQEAYDKADSEFDEDFKQAHASSRELLDAWLGSPLQRLSRLLESEDDAPEIAADETFAGQLLGAIVDGIRQESGEDSLAAFFATAETADRVERAKSDTRVEAAAAENAYLGSQDDVQLYSPSRHEFQLEHLAHRRQLAELQARFWSLLAEQPTGYLAEMTLLAASFGEQSQEYGRFLAEYPDFAQWQAAASAPAKQGIGNSAYRPRLMSRLR